MNKFLFFTFIWCLLISCNTEKEKQTAETDPVNSGEETTIQKNTNRNLYWGDTHLHTAYSADAFLLGTMLHTPGDAYRFAKGEALLHPMTKQEIRLQRPLDFLVVADHAESLGLLYEAKKGNQALMNFKRGKEIFESVNTEYETNAERLNASRLVRRNVEHDNPLTPLDTSEVARSVWASYVNFAEENYEPGKFTTFIGWEWTSQPDGKNMHRVVFTDSDQAAANKFLPFSASYSRAPEDLWQWLENTAAANDIDFISIPHNSNISGGLMFPEEVTFKGNPVDKSYAFLRNKWENVVEITQIKGTSETHPDLAPNDEYANFEIWPYYLTPDENNNVVQAKIDEGGFARSALKRGVHLEGKIGTNPYQFGVIGSSDAHTAMAAVEEDNFQGKFLGDGVIPDKSKELISTVKAMDFSSSGYAAVWAESNTREDIMAAFKRREVYATSGPRIQVRFFGGVDFVADDAQSADFVGIGYKKGVPMGSDFLIKDGQKPTFLLQIAKDSEGANLAKVQIVKGWSENGEMQERIFDIAQATDDKGQNEFAMVWTDDSFNINQNAFYYVRALEIPTPRFTTLAAQKLGVEPWEGKDAMIQERAYSSPIWFKK